MLGGFFMGVALLMALLWMITDAVDLSKKRRR